MGTSYGEGVGWGSRRGPDWSRRQVLSTLGGALILAGCGDRARLRRDTVLSQEGLERAADVYWRSMRWAMYDKVMPLAEDPSAFAELMAALLEHAAEFRVMDIEILDITLDPPPETGENSTRILSGTVTVRCELERVTASRVVQKVRQQRWIKRGGKWVAKLEGDELMWFLEK